MDTELIAMIISVALAILGILAAFLQNRKFQKGVAVATPYLEGFQAYEQAMADGTLTDEELIRIAKHSCDHYQALKSVFS